MTNGLAYTVVHPSLSRHNQRTKLSQDAECHFVSVAARRKLTTKGDSVQLLSCPHDRILTVTMMQFSLAVAV